MKTKVIQEQLKDTLDQAEWGWIKPHALRDSVILVDHSLDLMQAALAVANNEVATMKAWIDQGQIRKPHAEEIAEWDLHPSQKFQSIIVQPFVLIQTLRSLH